MPSKADSSVWTISASSTAAAPLPTGGYLEQADGTAWMALFCQNMLEIAAELALDKPTYADMVLKFIEHFLWIAIGRCSTGDGTRACGTKRTDSFTTCCGYPTAGPQRLKVRSMVGLLPLCAVTVFDGEMSKKYPEIRRTISSVHAARPELKTFIHDPTKVGCAGRRLASILDEDQTPPRAGEDAR